MTLSWKTAAGAGLLATLFLCSAASAQESVKIGFVDMQRALNESREGKKALDSLKQLMERKKAELQKEKDFVEKKKEELDKQGLLLNEATRREREDEIRRLERDHTRKLSDTKDELAREETKFTAKIRTDLLQIVEEIGKQEGYTMVLEKQFSAILYAPEKVDLTDAVIERYDAWKGQ